MPAVFPTAVSSYGNTSVAAVTGTLTESAPTVAQVTAADTSLTISCYLYGNGLEASAETNKGSAPKRACDTTERELSGATKWTLTDIEYVHSPQADPDDEANEARTLLAPGTELYLVERQGLPAKTTEWTVGQKVNIHHVRVKEQIRSRTGDDEYSEYSIKQALEYIEDPIFDEVLV